MSSRIIVGDCREVLAGYEADTFHAVVTDPPYELNFMGRGWDNAGVSFDLETWRAVYRVLKPGGYLLCFGGSRTFYRIAVAIEDAGFEIRDTLSWLYGSGFPKSREIGKAIDSEAGAVRKVIGSKLGQPGYSLADNGFVNKVYGDLHDPSGECAITAPATDAAREWDGWGTALKPAWENITVARKPFSPITERGIIVANLERLEAQLWSLLPASIAVESFGLSPADYDEACASVQWSAEERRSTLAGLCDQTDTSPFVSVMTTCLNTVRSWSDTFSELLTDTSTSTTGTESGPTIDLTTLKSLLSPITPRTIIQAATNEPGSTLSALPVTRYFVAVAKSMSATRELSALASATESARTRLPVEGALAPNWEPIIMARKPLSERTVAANVMAHGTGAINVDGCRIGHDGSGRWGTVNRGNTRGVYGHKWADEDGETAGSTRNPTGRWPPNVAMDEDAAALLDQMSGASRSTGGQASLGAFRNGDIYGKGRDEREKRDPGYGDTGGASRFMYVAKASRAERNAGLDGMPERSAGIGDERPSGQSRTRLDGRPPMVSANFHPTVKPVALMRWLVRMVTPPGGQVVDPFMGSGSTGVAAVLEGLHFTGIDLSDEYAEIARRRIAYAGSQPALFREA